MLDGALCAGAGMFYLVNRLWLSPAVSGPLGWFLTCYANDCFAGLAIAAWADLLPVTIGNLLGGVGLGALLWYCYRPKKEA